MVRDFVAPQEDRQRIMHRIALLHAASAPAGLGYMHELSDHARDSRHDPECQRYPAEGALRQGVDGAL
jgi:hypothetical protein